MALFEKREDGIDVPVSRGDKLNTIIGKDSVVSGTLEVAGTLRVDGIVRGEVTVSDTFSVGATGLVEASVQTKTAVISGTVRGNIYASEKIELQAKALIHGDIVTKSLVIEQGAVFEGHCNMGQNEESPAAKSFHGMAAPKEPVSSADNKR